MKNNLLKYYLTAILFCCTMVLFAQPGAEDEDGTGILEGQDPPTISQLTSNGTTVITQGCGGFTLVILGTNFSGATAVTVNSQAVASFVVTNDDTITAVLPTGPTSGLVEVTTPKGSTSSAGSFTVNVSLTPTFTPVAGICSGGSLSALPTTSNNGIAGTWSPALDNTTTTLYTFTPTAGLCATTATMTIIVDALTTEGSVTTSICAGDAYVWPANGQTYITAQNGITYVSGCNTATLNLTVTPRTTIGSITTSICEGDTYVWPANGESYTTAQSETTFVSGCNTATLNLSITPATTTGSVTTSICEGASYTWPANGVTYTTAQSGTTFVSGCNTATLNLTVTPRTTIGSITTSICEGDTYVWPANGESYNTAQSGTTFVSGCNTATLNLTITSPTTTGSVTTSICEGASYTWPANGVTYTTVQSGTTFVSGCNTATLNLSITPVTTTGSVTTSICEGASYTWPANGVIYTTAQSGITVVEGCNTATLNLTVTPSSDNVTTVSAVNSYTWANNGQTYTSSGIKTGTTTNCVTEKLNLTITTTQIPATFPGFCKGATIATATGSTSLKFYTAISGTAAAVTSTTALATKTYYVTETINEVESSPRVARAIVVNNLPTTLTALASLEAKNICKYIGSSTPVTFTATATGASSYIWTAPEGATIDPDGGQASISFENVSAIPGAIGSVTVKIVDNNGCISAPKALALTTTLPKAPTSLTMTSADSTPHFKGITTPAVVVDGITTVPAVYGLVGLNSLVKITKVGPYMGTETVFTLTAPEAITAASYAWTLPTGVNQLSGGNSNVITVDFADVEPGIGALPIVVQSVGGCGNSINRTLTLARALPSAPTKLVLTDDAISTTTAVTKVGPYTGKSTALTLTATPFTTQGGTATSYAWILPAGVNCETFNTPTMVKVKSTVNTGTELEPIYAINDVAAIATASSTITINFDDVQSGVTALPIQVFGVNGAGNSIARTLALTAAVPATPAIVGSGGTGSATQFSSCATKTYTATLIPGATYAWTLPAGATIVGAEDGNVIVVDYSNTTVAVGASGAAVTCTAINGTGSSVTKSLTVKRVVCPAPVKIAPEAATTEKFSAVAYPNPATEGFRVKSSNGKSFGVQVYDMLGRSIEQRQMSSDAQIGSNYAKGIYNVIVNQGANIKTLRVIKQ